MPEVVTVWRIFPCTLLDRLLNSRTYLSIVVDCVSPFITSYSSPGADVLLIIFGQQSSSLSGNLC